MRLAAGETLRAICRRAGFPAESTVRQWAVDDVEGFYAQYARARDFGIDSMADHTIEIADKVRRGQRVKRKEAGYQWVCPTCQEECSRNDNGAWQHTDSRTPLCEGVAKPRRERVYETEIRTGDMVERSRLMVDTRKWYTSKLAPKRYGDRALEGNGGGDRLHELARMVKEQSFSETSDDASE